MKKCYFCRGEVLKNKKIKIDLWRDDQLMVFENVPADVCSQCDEKYFSPSVSKELLRKANNLEDKKVKHMLQVPVISYARA